MGTRKPEATLVLPCLNEADSLKGLLEECQAAFGKTGEWEVLLADNGSTDRSVEIAEKFDCTILRVPKKGYGSAVHSGIAGAKGAWVVYHDADGTYSPRDATRLFAHARKTSADMVIGSRLKGTIRPDAMPFLHRYLGTPVLSFLIRLLYGLRITDCNSGIRCIRKESYLQWKVKSRGMEFASAILIKAALHRAAIIELPVTLRKGRTKRVPHLRKWRDGMRHLLVILAGAPGLFWTTGLILLGISSLFVFPTLWMHAIRVGHLGIGGPHTLAVSTVIGFYGALCFNLGLQIYAALPAARPKPRMVEWLLQISEGTLFWTLVLFSTAFAGGVLYLFSRWRLTDFGGLDYVRLALYFVYLTVVPLTLVAGLFQAHLQKRVDL